MSDPTDIAVRTQRFNEAVRAFTPSLPARHAKLMPTKDGIVELRQKGASLRLICELLATVGVAVGTDTIARFLAEVSGEQPLHRTSNRPSGARHARRRTVRVQPSAVPAATDNLPPPQPSSSSSIAIADAEKPPERSRARGPRIADPRNL